MTIQFQRYSHSFRPEMPWSYFGSFGGAIGTGGRGRRGWISLLGGPLGGVVWCSTITSPPDCNGTSAGAGVSWGLFAGRGRSFCTAAIPSIRIVAPVAPPVNHIQLLVAAQEATEWRKIL